MSKLWQKDYQLNTIIEEFTVGIDYLLDIRLLLSDVTASLAHGTMLNSIGILKDEDFAAIKRGMTEIVELRKKREFSIQLSDEDGHTAIENHLIQSCGEAGKKIHTGRSRNDQVITMTRVYSRAWILQFLQEGADLALVLLEFAEKYAMVPMPGRTHMQTAMPSSIGLWAASYAEEIIDSLKVLEGLYPLINRNPLGSAASYGVPLPLNRELVADLLGFEGVQNNVLAVNNSRGRFEAMILDAADYLALTFSKIAQDLILFSLPEFGYFKLPDALCTGSSIMPQKKNPDGLELMRAKAGTVSACSTQIKNILRSLPSGYNRDFQETKEPFLKGTGLIRQCAAVIKLTFQELEVNEQKLTAAFTPDIYATDKAIEEVLSGKSFRDAYREVGLSIDSLKDRDPVETLKQRTYTGTTGNLGLESAVSAAGSIMTKAQAEENRINTAVEKLVGQPLDLLMK